MNIVPKWSQYHLSSIEEATRKFDPEAMILRVNHKSEKSDLNAAALEKYITKEMEHGWKINLKTDLIRHVKDMRVIPLGVAELFSINENGYLYTKRCITS